MANFQLQIKMSVSGSTSFVGLKTTFLANIVITLTINYHSNLTGLQEYCSKTNKDVDWENVSYLDDKW